MKPQYSKSVLPASGSVYRQLSWELGRMKLRISLDNVSVERMDRSRHRHRRFHMFVNYKVAP